MQSVDQKKKEQETPLNDHVSKTGMNMRRLHAVKNINQYLTLITAGFYYLL